jgi:hypothetical protein
MSLGAVEKQAVLDQYLLVKTRNYTSTLQKFVTERFQKQESANNIRQLISRRLGLPSLKRKRTVNISLEVIKAAQSVLFDRTKPFSIQGQFCIQFSPILSKAINSGTINKRVIIYCLTKLDKANGYPPRCTKRNKTSHSSSELLQEPGATAAVVQAEGGGELGDAFPPPPIHAFASPEDALMHDEEEIQQDVAIVDAQPHDAHDHAVLQPIVQPANSPLQETANRTLFTKDYPLTSITRDQMKITDYRVVCKRANAAHQFYTGDQLASIFSHTHRVFTSQELADQYHMFLYYSNAGQQDSSRQEILGCVFVDIAENVSAVTTVKIYLLYTDPRPVVANTRLGSSIVQKLFDRFPDANFELCSKREAAPFWYKKGFVTKDAATMGK